MAGGDLCSQRWPTLASLAPGGTGSSCCGTPANILLFSLSPYSIVPDIAVGTKVGTADSATLLAGVASDLVLPGWASSLLLLSTGTSF